MTKTISARREPRDLFDVVIIGGGMVGLALARALVELSSPAFEKLGQASPKLKIAIIEARLPSLDFSPSSAEAYQPDLRVNAINGGIIEQLSTWGLWTEEHFPYRSMVRHMEIWDENSEGKLVFHASDSGEEYLSYIVENRFMVKALWESLQAFPEVTFFSPNECKWESLAKGSETPGLEWHLELQDGQKISANFLVGADGANSKVRALLGMSAEPVLYGQQAIVANILSEKSHSKTAYQRFLTQGPLAFLPLNIKGSANSELMSSIVWTTSTVEAESLMALSASEFELKLEEAFGHRLGKLTLVQNRASFPLRHHHAASYVGEGTKSGALLIGDAAHGIHPLAGLGVNLGFHDVGLLTEILREAKAKNRPLLTQQNFKKYERQAWAYNEGIRQSMTAINAVFSKGPSLDLFRKIRGSGMNLVNRFDIVKKLFSRAAQG